MCPKCLKRTRCGCKSCLSRNEGKMLLVRPERMSGDFVTCPYCRTKFHYDRWESFSYEMYEIKKFVEEYKKEKL